MAPSLQVLIDFLLAEIALCGDQGASLSDILNFTTAFYAKPDHDTHQKTHSVDRRFHVKVWSWLTRHPEVSVGKDHDANHLSFDDVEHDAHAPRVFVSKERTWLAIAGHEPDETKVLPTEFALLSIIALGRANGIPQTDLVRLSGQDKRSVPKRTDLLQKKGYIQKRAIQVKSTRTSLCTLCKFFKPEYLAGQASADQQQAGAAGPENRIIDFKVFTDKLFDILREYKIIARNDLKSHLGFSDAWRWKVLSRALRKFERIGVLKRVKAMSQYQDTVNKFHPCVMLLRDPSERDLELFHEFSRNLFSSLGQKGDVDEPDEDYEEEPERTNAGTVGMVKREESVEEAGRVLPTWTPDRSLHHIILDKVDAAGLSGIGNQGIIRGCFGAFFRRPLENTMARLVECWQLSQPPHLRHLAIVRDTMLQRTNAMYVHYSIRNFKTLVDAGEASWEAVEFAPKGGKNNKFRVPPVDAVPQLNEYGLPLPHSPDGLLKNGNATLLECMAACKPADYTRSSSDPVAVRLKDGSYTFRLGSYKPSSDGAPSQQSPTGRPKGRPKGTPNKPKLELHDPDDDDHQTAETMESTRPPKKSKRTEDRFKGLSEKEKLEALGMDDSWTEYNVLLLERANTGVYVTPRGRRRPVGKSRGRPRVSQLAVFKSPKLASFSWFTAEKDASQDAVSRPPSREQSAETPIVETPLASRAVDGSTLSRGAKRTFQTRESDEEAVTPTSSVPRGHRPKQIRRSQDTNGQDVVSTAHSQEPDALAPENQAKRKRQRSPSVVESQGPVLNGDVADTTRFKKQRQDIGIDTGPATTDLVEPSAGQISEAPAETTKFDVENTAGQDTEPPAKKPESKQGKRGRTDRGGSVAVLRRKIIVDIIERAGGAFPMGTELWYPFTTAWMKTKFKEKPDMRTIRTSIKHLVDAGKLRQQTFSGRDSKGVMMTKSIVTLPETLPDQSIVKEMQEKMLAEGNRFYFPPNTDINPELTKSGGIGALKREFKPIGQLPVETGLTVQLQQKPALVLAKEKRVQRQLLERLESDENLGDSGQNRVKRLMTIQRRQANNLTSIGRPGRGQRAPAVPRLTGVGSALNKAGKMKWLRSSMASMAMLMNPRQTFNPVTGTFSTDAGLAPARRLATRGRVPLLSSSVPYAMLMNPKQTFNPVTGTFGTNGSLAVRRVPREKAINDLPESLEGLFAQAQRHIVDPTRSTDPRTSQFFRDNDDILQWELENQQAFLEKTAGLQYITQTIPDVDTVPIEGNIRFDIDEPVPRRGPPRDPMVTRRRVRRSAVSTDTQQPQNERRLEKLNESIPSTTTQKSTTPRQPLRRNRVSTLPRSFVQRIMTAIVAVRVLAGGMEGRMVDWPLVARCFPDHDPWVLQDRARSLLNRNRLQIVKMQGDFQERFLEAYAQGQVPTIDYTDLDTYDWEGVVEWAQTKLDVPSSEKLPDLPATRAQFDSVFELREETPASLDEVFQNTHSVTINRKRALIASTPFAEPLPRNQDPQTQHRNEYLDNLTTAKTWVRANVITPEEHYRPLEARQSLEHFGDALITDAVHALVSERVIKMGNRGRITPGRNYDITEPFITALRRRAIDSTQLHRAAVFKSTVLDPRFHDSASAAAGATGMFEVDYNADDGDILALINLAATRQVALKPRDPPRDKYGLTDGGYLTRQMDKRKLRFAVDVLPAEDYVFGNPLALADKAPSPPPPPPLAPHGHSAAVNIPLWIDIHGAHSGLVWDLVRAAVVGCVASRPGIGAHGIAAMVRPAAAAWEIEMLLGWMERMGIVRAQGNGWVVREWWWMVLCEF